MSYTLKIEDYSDEVLGELEDAVKKALTLCGVEAQKYAKLICPVDTGNLKNSIAYGVEGKTMQIGTNVEYASVVELGTASDDELGTSRRKAQPYLQPAIADHEDEYRSIIKKELGG